MLAGVIVSTHEKKEKCNELADTYPTKNTLQVTNMSGYRILAGEFSHETNTFCCKSTDLSNFTSHTFLTRHEDIIFYCADKRTALSATIAYASEFNWKLDCAVMAIANPCGKVTAGTYEHIVAHFTDAINHSITQGTSYDGIILHLHGAMVSEMHEDADGELLRRIRQLVGESLPIIVTLDLHGNITPLMAQHASALIAVRTYPHIDYYERAEQGAKLMQRCLIENLQPTTIIAKPPLLRGLDGGRTQSGPLRALLDQADVIEAAGDVLVISICAGFTAADVYDIGPSVTITALPHQLQYASELAKQMSDYIISQRSYTSVNHLTIESAIDEIKQHCATNINKPLLIADVTDNPGSGHYGDATLFLKALIENNIESVVFYAIYDPDAAKQAANIGLGNTGSISLGGKIDPTIGGAPLVLEGRVLSLTDGFCDARGPMGMHVAPSGVTALFRCGGVDIAIISNNGQALDVAQVTALGCDITSKSVICVKSNHHFRASFEPIASRVITIDGGGLGSMILKGGTYVNVRRPIWPLDDMGWE